jgi:hypothetical protein
VSTAPSSATHNDQLSRRAWGVLLVRAIVVSLLAALLGAAATLVSVRVRGGSAPEPALAEERGRR